MHRRRVERRPAGIAFGPIVAVHVAVADRRHRPPEIVGELRVPVGDEGVGDAHVEQREQARAVGQAELPGLGEPPRRGLPRLREISRGPELHRLGLFGRARRALGAAKRPGLAVVARVDRARERRRRAGAELVGTLHHPGLRARVLLERRRGRRDPDARRRDRPVGVRHAGAVVGPVGLDRGRDSLAERDALDLRGAVGHRFQRGRDGLVDHGLLSRIQPEQDAMRGRRGGRFGRGLGHGGHRSDIARIAALDSIHCVGHRDVHHGEAARCRIGGDTRGTHDIQGGLVPIGDDVGARFERRERQGQGEASGTMFHGDSPSQAQIIPPHPFSAGSSPTPLDPRR